jgi:hypothetical protein
MNKEPLFCQYCGNSLDPDAVFCTRCGNSVTKPSGPNSQPISTNNPPQLPPQFTRPPSPIYNSSNAANNNPWQKIMAFTLIGVFVLVAVFVISSLVSKHADQNRQATLPVAALEYTPTELAVLPTLDDQSIIDTEAPVVTDAPIIVEPSPTEDMDALAKSLLTINFDPSTCKIDPVESYDFEGTVTNNSDTYSISNVFIGGNLVGSNGNIIMKGSAMPDALVLRPHTTTHFWFWIDWGPLDGYHCDVYVISANISNE